MLEGEYVVDRNVQTQSQLIPLLAAPPAVEQDTSIDVESELD